MSKSIGVRSMKFADRIVRRLRGLRSGLKKRARCALSGIVRGKWPRVKVPTTNSKMPRTRYFEPMSRGYVIVSALWKKASVTQLGSSASVLKKSKSRLKRSSKRILLTSTRGSRRN